MTSQEDLILQSHAQGALDRARERMPRHLYVLNSADGEQVGVTATDFSEAREEIVRRGYDPKGLHIVS